MMKVLAFFVAFFIFHAEGCAPGTGTLGTKASFAFEMIPPAIYTYCDGCDNTAYVQIDSNFAYQKVKSDIRNSINQVLQANSIPTNDINPPTVTYTPPNVQILAAGVNCTAATEVIATGNTLYYKCVESSAGVFTPAPFSVPLTVQVTAISSIYQSQWDALATQVEDKMRTLSQADFRTEPIVTVSN